MKKTKKSLLIILLTILLLSINSSPCTAQIGTFEGVIVFIELDGNIYLLFGETNTYLQLTEDADIYHYQYPRFSPDGKMLAFLKSNPEKGELVFDLYVMDFNSKISNKLAEDVNSWGNYSWAPDSKSIVFAYSLDVVCEAPDRDTALGIFQVNVNTGDFEEIIPAAAQSTPLKEPVLSDDGNWIIYDSYPCFSEGWNIHTQNQKSGESYNFSVSQLDWMPDENMLAWTQELSSGGDGGVYLISADQKQNELIYMPENLTAASPHWSADGKWLIVRQYTRVEGFFFGEEKLENWVDELVLITENGDLKETLCATKTVNACQFQAWSPYGNAVIFTLEEDGQKEWKYYSLETENISNLADFGEGGIDWATDVQLPETEPTAAPTATLQKITETPELQKEIQSTQTTSIEPEKMRSNIIILMISGICLFLMGLLVVVFLVVYLRKKRAED